MRSQTITLKRARRMRRALTPPEVALWSQLKGRRHGFAFRRQHPVGPFILDFFCETARLAVEVDGAGHFAADRQVHDARRDAWMRERSIATLRIPAFEVMEDLEAAAATIPAEVRRRAPSTASRSPSPADAVED